MDFKNKPKKRKINLFYRDLNATINLEKEKDFWEMFLCLYFLFQKETRQEQTEKDLLEINNDYKKFIRICRKFQKEGKTLQDVFNSLPNNKWVKIKKKIVYKLILKKIPSNSNNHCH